MGLRTRSAFYYGQQVDKTLHFISIDEGTGELVVNLTPSGYSFTELGVELARALNEAGLNTYLVSTNRLTRKYTITSSAPFDILGATGTYFGSPLYTVLGFTASDKTGLSTYTSDFATGSVWSPQLPLFDYLPSSHSEGSLSATQDQSGNGNVEVITFGTVNYMECSAQFITDRLDKPDIIPLDTTATASAMAFLSYIRKKNRVEFMEDADRPETFETLLLEKSGSGSQGLEVKLTEMTGQRLQDYYQFSTLTFRKVS